MTNPLIEARGIDFRRAGRDILQSVSLTVGRGEAIALTGPSGSGKSALLTLIAGLERPDAGTLTIHADDSEIGLVLQGYGLVGLLTVEENVAMPLLASTHTPLPPEEVHALVRQALDTVEMADLGTKLVETLSGGQQQRVAIARALVTRPTLLLADEPSAALDSATRERVINALLQLQAAGSTIVIATHDMTIADSLDRRVELRDGRILTQPELPDHD